MKLAGPRGNTGGLSAVLIDDVVAARFFLGNGSKFR
jgi:hypothetical protein